MTSDGGCDADLHRCAQRPFSRPSRYYATREIEGHALESKGRGRKRKRKKESERERVRERREREKESDVEREKEGVLVRESVHVCMCKCMCACANVCVCIPSKYPAAPKSSTLDTFSTAHRSGG